MIDSTWKYIRDPFEPVCSANEVQLRASHITRNAIRPSSGKLVNHPMTKKKNEDHSPLILCGKNRFIE